MLFVHHSSLPFIFLSPSLLLTETVNPLPISITTTGSQEIGSTYTLQCIVTSVNTPTIIWKNSTDIISNTSVGIEVGDLVNDGDTWSVTLTFNPLLQSHEEEYMCTAYMNFDASDITNETITVDVISECLYICLSIYRFIIYLSIYLSNVLFINYSSIYVYMCMYVSIPFTHLPIYVRISSSTTS